MILHCSTHLMAGMSDINLFTLFWHGMHNGWHENLEENLFRQDLDLDQRICCGHKPKNGALKSGFYLSKMLFCFNESPLKVMENAFYFMLKGLFVFEIFRFLSWLLGYVKKRLNKVNFKIYDVTDGTTNNYNTLPNMSRSKGNQTMKFGLLIECNIRK